MSSGNCCTWVDCQEPATHDHVAGDREVWARLCEKHHAEFETVEDRFLKEGGSENTKAMLRAWVRAGGGAKKMAERTMRSR